MQQQEKLEGSWEGGHDGAKAAWKGDRSLSSLLKHSCLLCWSSPRDTDVVETDERVLAKEAEIRVRRPQHLALVCACVCASWFSFICVRESVCVCVSLFYFVVCKWCGQDMHHLCDPCGVLCHCISHDAVM